MPPPSRDQVAPIPSTEVKATVVEGADEKDKKRRNRKDRKKSPRKAKVEE